MNLSEYQKEVIKNFKPDRPLTAQEARILNWSLGAAGEAGEIADVIKHYIFHLQPLDIMELVKEIGDCFWYLTALCYSLGINADDCLELNVAKLQFRHGGAFTYESSLNKAETERTFKDTEIFKEIKRRIENGRS